MTSVFLAFVVILAAFLYWKFGKKISLGGVGAGMIDSLASTGTEGKRFGFLVLLALAVFGASVVLPEGMIYAWIEGNKLFTLFVVATVAVYIINGPKSITTLKVMIFGLIIFGIYSGLVKNNTIDKEWWTTKNETKTEPVKIQPVPQAVLKPQPVVRTVNITATQHHFTWIQIPAGSALHNFKCPLGTIMAVAYSDGSQRYHDCDEKKPLTLGYGITGIGFRTKGQGALGITMQTVQK